MNGHDIGPCLTPFSQRRSKENFNLDPTCTIETSLPLGREKKLAPESQRWASFPCPLALDCERLAACTQVVGANPIDYISRYITLHFETLFYQMKNCE